MPFLLYIDVESYGRLFYVLQELTARLYNCLQQLIAGPYNQTSLLTWNVHVATSTEITSEN